MSGHSLPGASRIKQSNCVNFARLFPDRQGDFNLFNFDGFLPVSLCCCIDERRNSYLRVLTAQAGNRF